jgi:hypothetical protein
MNSIQLDSASVPSQLVILMQGAKEGRSDAIAELRRQLSKYKHPKAVLEHLARELKSMEEKLEKRRAIRAAEREKHQTSKFAPTHPVFRKSRANKGARRTDAFAYRVILCGGFETNRRRH